MMRDRGRRRDRDDRYTPAIGGPTTEDIAEAIDEITSGDPTETPSVRAVETLQEAGVGFPLTANNRTIHAVGIAQGQPQHGEMRSDTHINRWEVEYEQDCPEDDCPSQTTRYEVNTYHHIAGGYEKFCPFCKTVHDSEEWG